MKYVGSRIGALLIEEEESRRIATDVEAVP